MTHGGDISESRWNLQGKNSDSRNGFLVPIRWSNSSRKVQRLGVLAFTLPFSASKGTFVYYFSIFPILTSPFHIPSLFPK